MYFEFYGLTTSPFNNTPDPRFFFNTPDHEEALASLLYAVEERKGFVLVTGEVGAGKTLLSRMVLNRVGSNVKTALITHTRLSGPELLIAICREFEIDIEPGATSAQAMRLLEDFLLEQYARDRLAVVIIDEAQNLPMEALEELRMLGNLEADDAKLLQVLLLGQPELQETFRNPAMRQTYQRIFRTFHLRALDAKQTQAYIEHRLRVAGHSRTNALFEPRAVETIFQYTAGIPRLVNQLCDNALLAAFSDSKKSVSEELILEVIDQMMSLSATTPAQQPKLAGASRRPAPDSISAPRESIMRPGLSDQFARHDDYLRGLADKLEQFERKLKTTEHSAARGPSQTPAVGSDISAARDLRNEAVELLRTVTTTVRDADLQMREVLERAHRTADAVQGRAMANLGVSQKENALLREQTKTAFDEVQCFTREQKSVILRVLEEGRSEVEAAREHRRQAAELCRKAEESQAAAESRINATMAEAGCITQRIESEAISLLAEARRENSELQSRIVELMNEVQARNEQTEKRASDFIGGRSTEFESLRKSFDEFAARFAERNARIDAEHEQVLTQLKSQAHQVIENMHGVRDRTQARIEQVNAKTEEFIRDLQTKMETTQSRVVDLSVAAEERIKTAAGSLTTVRDQLLAEAEGTRAKSTLIITQAEQTLASTRDQCNKLLGEMRAQAETQARKAEESFQSRVAEGLATLNEITSRLADARRATDQSREDLDKLVKHATGEVTTARSMLDSTLGVHRSEIAKLSNDANAIKVDFQVRFEEARSALDALIQDHRRTTSQRSEELRSAIDQRIDAAHGDAELRVRSLQGDLRVAGETASGISSELKTAIELAEAHIRDCQIRFARESENVQKEVTQLIEKNRALVEGTRTAVNSLSRQASETAGTMRTEISLLKEAARSRIDKTGQEFEQLIGNTTRQIESLRSEADNVAVDLAERLSKTRDIADKAVDDSEKAAVSLRQQTKVGLVEVRECLLQMTDRADQLRRELVNMGDEVAGSARTSTDQVQKAGDRVASQIENVRDAVQRDADANFKRLALVRKQVEQSAEQMRENAAKLLDQVQTGASALRIHADELLSRAQHGSERITETASQLLLQAQTASEKFREQAESLLQKAKSTAGEVREHVQSLKANVSNEVEQIRRQSTATMHEMEGARQIAEQFSAQTAANEQRAATRADELIRQAQAAQTKSESLLAMPKELVEEAKRQAAALSQMSRKISMVVKQLSTAEIKAEHNKTALDQATTAADEKVDLLKRHTERLGQLVGIIRQLYGTMDSRIERLRGRLGQADELVRSVPQDIESLRAAFDADDEVMHRGGPSNRIGAGRGRATNVSSSLHAESNREQETYRSGASGSTAVLDTTTVRARQNVKPKTNHPGKAAETQVAQKTTVHGTPTQAASPAIGGAQHNTQSAKSSLGDIVQKSQKLNEWLREMLGEEALNKHIPGES